MVSRVQCLLSEGFRVFFLSAGAFGFLVIGIWTLSLAVPNAGIFLPGGQSLQSWHAHEMIFGYGAAALAGFFLTAVPNWTKSAGANPKFITLLAALWGLGRLAMFFSGSFPTLFVAVLDLAFMPVMAANIALQLFRKPKPQNLLFLALLLIIWLGNLRVHLDWAGFSFGDETAGLRVGLLAICAMIAILGGRITPAFTRNAMRAAGVERGLPTSTVPLDAVASIVSILLPISILLEATVWIVGTLSLVAGVAQFSRLAGWSGKWTMGKPILWGLHLALTMLAVGYLSYGLAQFGFGSEIGALHILAIGAVGGMTLAVMSRAALGHTGRPLQTPKYMALAFALLPVSALLRWIGGTGTPMQNGLYLASGVLWCCSMLIFVCYYWPILSRPRPTKS